MKTPEQIVREATGMRPALSDWTGRKEQMAVAKAAMLEALRAAYVKQVSLRPWLPMVILADDVLSLIAMIEAS